jgi:hypothetical protein
MQYNILVSVRDFIVPLIYFGVENLTKPISTWIGFVNVVLTLANEVEFLSGVFGF